MDEPIRIRRAGEADGEAVFAQLAAIHHAVVPGFLATLGEPFLARLYRVLATSGHSFVFVAERGEEVLGLIAGSMNTGKVYRDFMWRAGVRGSFLLGRKLLSLRRLRRMLETLLYPKQQTDLPDEEILNFCLRHDAQRQGIGGRLFRALEEEFLSRGVQRIKIVTGGQQFKAHRFYEKLGARKVLETEVHKGTKSFIYLHDLAGAAAAKREA